MLLIISYHYYASSRLKVNKSVDSNKRVGRPIICNADVLSLVYQSASHLNVSYNFENTILLSYYQYLLTDQFLQSAISTVNIFENGNSTFYYLNVLSLFSSYAVYFILVHMLIPASRCYFVWSTSITHRFANASIKKTVGLKRLYNIVLMLPSP